MPGSETSRRWPIHRALRTKPERRYSLRVLALYSDDVKGAKRASFTGTVTYPDLENPPDKLKVVSDPIDYFARHAGELLGLMDLVRELRALAV